jgi:hypothetical protein
MANNQNQRKMPRTYVVVYPNTFTIANLSGNSVEVQEIVNLTTIVKSLQSSDGMIAQIVEAKITIEAFSEAHFFHLEALHVQTENGVAFNTAETTGAKLQTITDAGAAGEFAYKPLVRRSAVRGPLANFYRARATVNVTQIMKKVANMAESALFSAEPNNRFCVAMFQQDDGNNTDTKCVVRVKYHLKDRAPLMLTN